MEQSEKQRLDESVILLINLHNDQFNIFSQALDKCSSIFSYYNHSTTMKEELIKKQRENGESAFNHQTEQKHKHFQLKSIEVEILEEAMLIQEIIFVEKAEKQIRDTILDFKEVINFTNTLKNNPPYDVRSKQSKGVQMKPKTNKLSEFWKNNKSKYRILFEYFKCYATAQATSTPSERIFSRTNYQIWDRRNNISPEKIKNKHKINKRIPFYSKRCENQHKNLDNLLKHLIATLLNQDLYIVGIYSRWYFLVVGSFWSTSNQQGQKLARQNKRARVRPPKFERFLGPPVYF
ncbi:hypothetical protein BpHYR1_040358 [Brachionus plicatilis]|uniref:HAT C-terminal dimerisation domain-containing protein n=1 Tax=Brachionus plicatilis TaxID=10195 RepID=A0A3M7QX13_BRAPC|nr:hypothetical protein BpHYR1_040358 [Brachionus plicatilis]